MWGDSHIWEVFHVVTKFVVFNIARVIRPKPVYTVLYVRFLVRRKMKSNAVINRGNGSALYSYSEQGKSLMIFMKIISASNRSPARVY